MCIKLTANVYQTAHTQRIFMEKGGEEFVVAEEKKRKKTRRSKGRDREVSKKRNGLLREEDEERSARTCVRKRELVGNREATRHYA